MSRHSLSGARKRSDDTVRMRIDPRRGPEVTRVDWSGSSPFVQIKVLTMRSLATAFGDFRLVFFGLLQPIVMLLLFSQVFSGLGTLPGVAQYDGYINFLMPATLVNIAMTTAMGSGVGMLTEIYTGFIGRLRAMPINMFAVLVARTVSDALRLAVQLVVSVIAAVAFLNFSPAGWLEVTAALALTTVFGWGLGWVFVALATWQGKPETMQAVSFIVMFPLMFASSAYVPLAAMPTWIRYVSTVNPMTYAIDATRALCVGTPLGNSLLYALGLITAMGLIGALIANRNFRRAK